MATSTGTTPGTAPQRPLSARLRAESSNQSVLALHAGRVAYRTGWTWQQELVRRRAADEIPDVLLTLEHDPVFTAGKNAHPEHVLWDDTERERRGVDLVQVDRGGDVTYHGPGQAVAYPILRLDGIRNVVDYVRALEEVCVRTAADFGIAGRAVDGYTGVWVGDAKLVAIGVRVSSRGVTSHGLAFNVTTDLDHFSGIVPCGIPDRGVCSLASLGVCATVEDVVGRLRANLADVLACTVTQAPPDAVPPPSRIAS